MTSAYRNEDFKGKSAKIRDHYSCFWSQPSAVADVKAYLDGDQAHQYDQTPETLKKWIKGKSHFQKDNLKPEEILAENKHAVILGNGSSFDMVQYPGAPGRAGMSFIHVLGLPKQQIFNGVSLTQDNCRIIDEIIGLFEYLWGRDVPNNEFRRKVIDYQLETTKHHEAGMNEQDVEVRAEAARDHHAELCGKAHFLEAEDFDYGLHLWPEQSVGHLHIHIIARPREMRHYSTLDHDEKTVDAREVRDFIMKEGPEHYGPAYEEYNKYEDEEDEEDDDYDDDDDDNDYEEDDYYEDDGDFDDYDDYEEVPQALYQSSHQPS